MKKKLSKEELIEALKYQIQLYNGEELDLDRIVESTVEILYIHLLFRIVQTKLDHVLRQEYGIQFKRNLGSKKKIGLPLMIVIYDRLFNFKCITRRLRFNN